MASKCQYGVNNTKLPGTLDATHCTMPASMKYINKSEKGLLKGLQFPWTLVHITRLLQAQNCISLALQGFLVLSVTSCYFLLVPTSSIWTFKLLLHCKYLKLPKPSCTSPSSSLWSPLPQSLLVVCLWVCLCNLFLKVSIWKLCETFTDINFY